MRIAIAGAGVAGLVCAWQLAKQEHEVTLFEQMDDLDAQGSGVLIQPVGLVVLQMLGIRHAAELLGRKIYDIDGRSLPSNRVSVAVDYRKLKGYNYALGIDRTVLWKLIYEKVAASRVVIKTGISIDDIHYQSDGSVSLADTRGRTFKRFDLVIDASGAHSQLRHLARRPIKSKQLHYGSLWTKIRLKQKSSLNRNTMTLFSDDLNIGIGILPTGKFLENGADALTMFFNLKWRDCPEWNTSNFLQWKQSVSSKWPATQHLIEYLNSSEQLYLAKFMQHTLLWPYGNKVAFIGDSAHASNPQLGQGLSMSLIDAVSLAWSLANYKDVEEALNKYSKLRRNHVIFYQTLARILTPFYQSDNPVAIDSRELFYPILSNLMLIKTLTAKLVSGQVCARMRYLQTEMQTAQSKTAIIR